MLKKIFLLLPLLFIMCSCTYKKEVNKYRPLLVKKKLSKPQKRTEVFYYYHTPDHEFYNLFNWDKSKVKEEPKEPLKDVKQKKKERYRYTNWR